MCEKGRVFRSDIGDREHPSRFQDKVVRYVSDAGAGGAHACGRAIELDPSANSSIGG